MATERELEEARAQAEEVGAALLLLLGLKKGTKSVVWDERGYFTIGGKKVGVLTIRRLLTKVEKVGSARLKGLVRAYFAGRLTLPQWRSAMDTALAGSHLLFGALALGSLEAAAASAIVAERLAEQRRFASGFGDDLRSRKVSEARGESRASSYLLAASILYHVLEQAVQGRGPSRKTQAKRIRRASESCPGCLIYAGRWIPINQMPPIGSLDCGSRCRCYLIYR